jgi:hypothetical protein
MYIKFDGTTHFVDTVYQNELEFDGCEYVVFASAEDAGHDARKYWEDLAQDDPKEFTCIVGEKALIAWGLGQNYAPGSIGVNSLEEWLDLWLDTPEEHFAIWDSQEIQVQRISPRLCDALGWSYDHCQDTDAVLYRTN